MSKEARENRAASMRTAEWREQTKRKMRRNRQKSELDFPPEIVPAGMEYAWGNYSVCGTPTPARMMQLREDGWSAVPAERHPEMAFNGVVEVGQDYEMMKNFIWRRGSVLMERPIEYGEIERELQAEDNLAVMLTLPNSDNFLGDPSIPTKAINETSTYKGIRDVAFGR